MLSLFYNINTEKIRSYLDNNTLDNNQVGNTSESNLVNTTDRIDQTIIVSHQSHISEGVRETYNVTQPDNSQGNLSNYKRGIFIYIFFISYISNIEYYYNTLKKRIKYKLGLKLLARIRDPGSEIRDPSLHRKINIFNFSSSCKKKKHYNSVVFVVNKKKSYMLNYYFIQQRKYNKIIKYKNKTENKSYLLAINNQGGLIG